MSQEEIVNRLNELLEAERAGVEAATGLATADMKSYTRDDIRKFGEDEGWACSGLRRGGGGVGRGGGRSGLGLPPRRGGGGGGGGERRPPPRPFGLDPQTLAFLVEMRE